MRGAGAGQAADDDRPGDLDVLDLGVLGDQGLQPQPVHQVPDELLEDDGDSDVGQPGLLTQRRGQDVQPFAEAVVAPAVQPGALSCSGQQGI